MDTQEQLIRTEGALNIKIIFILKKMFHKSKSSIMNISVLDRIPFRNVWNERGKLELPRPALRAADKN